MTITLIVLSLLFFLIRGIIEGMVMTAPLDLLYPRMLDEFKGIRKHPWFGSYHVLCLLRESALIGVTILFVQDSTLLPLLWGLAMLGWELSELGYAGARNGLAIARYPENVMGLGIQIRVPWVYYLHGVRIVAGSLLLWRAL